MLKSPGQIIAESCSFYQKTWKKILPFLVALFVPGLIAVFVREIFSNLPGRAAFFILESVLVIGLSLVSLGCTITLIRVLAAILQNNKPDDTKKELSAGMKLILPAFIVSILIGLAIFGGFLLLIIPAIIFSIWFSFGVYAVALDGKTGITALRTSRELVRGRWWSTFWRLILPALLFAFIAWVLQGLVSLPFEWGYRVAASPALQQTIIMIAKFVNMVIAFVVLPLSTLAPTILYLDLKKNPVQP